MGLVTSPRYRPVSRQVRLLRCDMGPGARRTVTGPTAAPPSPGAVAVPARCSGTMRCMAQTTERRSFYPPLEPDDSGNSAGRLRVLAARSRHGVDGGPNWTCGQDEDGPEAARFEDLTLPDASRLIQYFQTQVAA